MKKRIILVFSVFSIFVISMIWISVPVIYQITPSVAKENDVIEIKGRGFGTQIGNNFVSINGKKLPINAYVSWNKNNIKIKMLKGIDSGFVVVNTYLRKSDYVLLSKRNDKIKINDKTIIQANIKTKNLEIERQDVVEIEGDQIPFNKGNNEIFYTGLSSEKTPLDEEDYLYWSKEVIKIRTPEFIKDEGNFYLELDNKEFIIPYKIKNNTNKFQIDEKQEYNIKYKTEYDFQNVKFENILDFYSFRTRIKNYKNQIVTLKKESSFFKNKEMEFIKLYKGKNSTEEEFLVKNFGYSVIIEDINLIPKEYKEDENYKKYTKKSSLEDELALAKKIDIEIDHPYKMAKSIFELAFAEYKGNKELFCKQLREALRKYNIPARLVYAKTHIHGREFENDFYVEFYLEKFGFVPIEIKKNGFGAVKAGKIIIHKEGDELNLNELNFYKNAETIKEKDGAFDLLIYADKSKTKKIKYNRKDLIVETS